MWQTLNWQTLKLSYYNLEKHTKHKLEETFTVYLKNYEISCIDIQNNKCTIFKSYYQMNQTDTKEKKTIKLKNI